MKISSNRPFASGLPGRRFCFVAAGALLSALSTGAQETTPTSEKVVELPVFSVRDVRSSAYGAKEAISTTRVSIPILDVPQTVSVVTRELMDDTLGFRLIDTAKYVTPISESSLVSGGDRITLRGYQISQRFIDGVNVSGLDGYNMSSDSSNIERLEIIKGPNAILVPGGSPGGMMNQITKSPKFENFFNAMLILKTYLGTEASIDLNRVFSNKKDAFRLVVSGWDSDGYFRDQFRRGYLVAPSYTHLFSNGAELTFKLEDLYNIETQGIGDVIDPSVGTGDYARVKPGFPRDNTWGPHADNRRRWETRFITQLNLKIGDALASRLWLMADHAERNDQGAPGGAPAFGDQGARNPMTGRWTPFITYGAGPTFTPTMLTPSTSTIYNRTGQANYLVFDELHFKNDYAYEVEFSPNFKSTTIGGLSANYQRVRWKNWSNTRAPLDLSNPVYDTPITSSTLLRDKLGAQQDLQVFGYERLTMFHDHIIVAGGASQFWGVLERLDDGNLPAVVARSLSNRITDANIGLIYKPIPEVSIFAGYNKVGGALPSSILAGEQPRTFKIQVGDQKECGVKTSFMEGRLNAAFSYFEIAQNNFQVPNSAFNLDPTQPQFLFLDLNSKGWEIEVSALITPQLTLVGNYTDYKARGPYDVRQRMVPDQAGGLFAKYEFTDGPVKGFGITFGLDYSGDQAGDQASGITAASTATNPIPNQPSFFVASRTVLQLGFLYHRERWSALLNIGNLLDKDYIQSAGSRSTLIPGEPRNISGSVSIKF